MSPEGVGKFINFARFWRKDLVQVQVGQCLKLIRPRTGHPLQTPILLQSFGVLVLEMVTRKKPTDDMFVGGLSLHKWAKSHYHGSIEEMLDPTLVIATRDQSKEVKKMWEIAIGELIELGILCTQESPSIKPTMLDAADDLDRLKRYLTEDTTGAFASSFWNFIFHYM